MRSIGKLKHAGFAESQMRAMAEFVEELVDGTVRPIAQRMDQRFEKVDLNFDQVGHRLDHADQRFEQIDQRLDQVVGQVDQRFEQVHWRLDLLEGWVKQVENQTGQGFAMMTGQLQLIADQLRNLSDSGRQLQSRPWLSCLLIGLAISVLHLPVIGVLLVLLLKPFG